MSLSKAAAVAALLVLLGPTASGTAAAPPATAAAAGELPAPYSVQVRPEDPMGTALVRWVRPVPGDGSTYVVYRDLPDGTHQVVDATIDKGYVLVHGGQNPGGAGYCFRVVRVLGNDASDPSDQSCGHVSGQAPIAAPGPLTVVPLSSDRLYVSWQRPLPGDGSTYEVHVQLGNGSWARKAVVGDVFAAHLSGLAPNTTYCVNVVRIEQGIRSGWSSMGCATTNA